MNSFQIFKYMERNYRKVIEGSVLIEYISWEDIFNDAIDSVFICGGEFRKGDEIEEAEECIKIAKQKRSANPNFHVSVMCGQWIYAGTKPSSDNTPAENNMMRELHKAAIDGDDWITFYYNYLNVVESVESGYLHSIVVDEGEESQKAYLEQPHGDFQEGDYEKRKWIISSNADFVNDVIQIRERFCLRYGIIPQDPASSYNRIVERTLYKDDFHLHTNGWNFSTCGEYDECKRRWKSKELITPISSIAMHNEQIAKSAV